jgi:hypothetical protein
MQLSHFKTTTKMQKGNDRCEFGEKPNYEKRGNCAKPTYLAAFFACSVALIAFFRRLDKKPEGLGYEEFQGSFI